MKLFESIPASSQVAKLRLAGKEAVPRLNQTTVLVNGWGSKLETKHILEVFVVGRKRCKVFRKQEDGTLLVVGLDKLSMPILAMAFYVSKVVFFKVRKTRIG